MLQQTSLVSVVDKAVKNGIRKYPKRRIDQKADVLTFKYDEDRENRVGLLSMKMELF